MKITIKTDKEIETMRRAGEILAEIMEELKKQVEPGISTWDLEKKTQFLIKKNKVKPSFKGYQGFPCALCTCINSEIVHCLPSKKRILKQGDIISLDLGILYKEFHADMAITMPVGDETDSESLRLIRVTKKALKRGIKKARPGITTGDIGNTIQRYVESQGYNVIRDLCGHGIGRELHEDPQILNFGKRRKGFKLKEGMTICIEPMVSIGDWKIKKAKDGYGYETKDGSLSAHFEHTILITKNGAQILTEKR